MSIHDRARPREFSSPVSRPTSGSTFQGPGRASRSDLRLRSVPSGRRARPVMSGRELVHELPDCCSYQNGLRPAELAADRVDLFVFGPREESVDDDISGGPGIAAQAGQRGTSENRWGCPALAQSGPTRGLAHIEARLRRRVNGPGPGAASETPKTLAGLFAGVGAVKVASLPLRLASLGDCPAVRRIALPRSSRVFRVSGTYG